jgi:hypothetical protein
MSAVRLSLSSLTRILFGFFGGEERVGVEPTLPFGKPDFESGAFGHSAISPGGRESYAAAAAEGQAPKAAPAALAITKSGLVLVDTSWTDSETKAILR